jgi:hypothetical protein
MTTRVARASMCALVTSLAIPTPATAAGPDPTSADAKRSVQGTVLVNRRVLKHKKEAAEALEEVNAQLGRIARVVAPKPLAKLRKVRIWVEWANHPETLTEFHPSAQWLRENGYNPEKAGGVEVANARKFIECARDDQPWALMHEMAHHSETDDVGPLLHELVGKLPQKYRDPIVLAPEQATCYVTLMMTDLICVKRSRPYGPFSRPQPLCLKPPHGDALSNAL